MKYKNAKKVLPERLLKELQQYVQGEIIYVPGSDEVRARWGENNGTRKKYEQRNEEIIKCYISGICIEKIAERFYLSEYSIRKIINNNKFRINKLKEAII